MPSQSVFAILYRDWCVAPDYWFANCGENFLNNSFLDELGCVTYKGSEIMLLAKLLHQCFTAGVITIFMCNNSVFQENLAVNR